MVLTSKLANHKESMTVLQVMFGADENHAHEMLVSAFDNPGSWEGNGVVMVRCESTAPDGFVYRIQYRGV